MLNHRNLGMLGIGVVSTAMVVTVGYHVQAQEIPVPSTNFIGNWQIIQVNSGDKEDEINKDSDDFVQMEISDDKLIVGWKGPIQAEFKLTGQRKLSGIVRMFGYDEKPIHIPATLELSENNQQITVRIMPSKVDNTKLLSRDFGQLFDHDYTFKLDKMTESVASVQAKQQAKYAQSEGRTYVGTMNKGEQAYYTEKDKFTTSIEELGIGIRPETASYSYKIKLMGKNGVQTLGIAKNDNFKSYTGAVFVIKINRENTTVAILCQSEKPGKIIPPAPKLVKNIPQCATGTKELYRD